MASDHSLTGVICRQKRYAICDLVAVVLMMLGLIVANIVVVRRIPDIPTVTKEATEEVLDHQTSAARITAQVIDDTPPYP